MTTVIDVQDPRDRVADLNRRMTANAAKIEAVIARAAREQRSDLSRRVPQINHGSRDADERPTVLLDREQRIAGRLFPRLARASTPTRSAPSVSAGRCRRW